MIRDACECKRSTPGCNCIIVDAFVCGFVSCLCLAVRDESIRDTDKFESTYEFILFLYFFLFLLVGKPKGNNSSNNAMYIYSSRNKYFKQLNYEYEKYKTKGIQYFNDNCVMNVFVQNVKLMNSFYSVQSAVGTRKPSFPPG